MAVHISLHLVYVCKVRKYVSAPLLVSGSLPVAIFISEDGGGGGSYACELYTFIHLEDFFEN